MQRPKLMSIGITAIVASMLLVSAPRTATAVYSGLVGNEGLAIAFGVRGDLELQWRGYEPTATVRNRPAVKAWRIKKSGMW